MPTLLQINVASNWGSTGRIVEQIGIQAEKAGWNSYVAHGPRFVNPSKLRNIQINSRLDEIIHGLWYSLLQDKHGLGSVAATKKFIQIVKDVIKPDIVHLHNIHGYYLNYPILFDYLRQADIQVVWTLHDCWTMTGHCTHFDYIGCDLWKSGCHNCPLLHSYPISLFKDNSLQNYYLKKKYFTSLEDKITIITVSHWLESLVHNSFLKELKVRTIYNGVSTSTFHPCSLEGNNFRFKYGLEGKFIAVACATAWSEMKGFSDYIRLSSVIDKRYVIVLIGLTNKQIRTLPQNIIGIPRTQNIQELVNIYSDADVILNLSYQESLGMTTIEGMSCGTPSIVYNSTASPELVDQTTGYVVEKGNIFQVYEKMEEIYSKSKTLYSSACQNRVETIFNQDLQIKKYIDLYNEILNNK